MNIFYLSEYADEAAEMHCDKHASKMVLETAQMLSAVRASEQHYYWTLELLWYLSAEKLLRFGTPHKSASLISGLAVPPDNIEDNGFTPPPQCMPDQYKCEYDTVLAYRNYYHGEKPFAVWKYTQQPTWWKGYRYA